MFVHNRYQSLHLDRVIKVPCRLIDLSKPLNAKKLKMAKTTRNNGISEHARLPCHPFPIRLH
jgi:hypothetical protein